MTITSRLAIRSNTKSPALGTKTLSETASSQTPPPKSTPRWLRDDKLIYVYISIDT
jgi:hypothetical protein